MDSERGLYGKYIVSKAEDGSPVFDCFILRPDRDSHARAALRAYARSCNDENNELAGDLFAWLRRLERPREFFPTHGEIGQAT